MVNAWLKELHLLKDEEGGVVRLGNGSKKFDKWKGEMEHTYASEGGEGEVVFIFRSHFVLISHTKNAHDIHITLVAGKDNTFYPYPTFHVKRVIFN